MSFNISNFVRPATKLSWWCDWLSIFGGCFILAAGFVLFVNPYNLVPGGVYGASVVMHNLFPSIQVGTFGYMFDIPLMIISMLVLGSKLGARTIVAAMTTPFIMNWMSWIIYPSREALESLDPSQMLGGVIDLSDHLMLATLIGGLLIGLGCGIVVRKQATTGGTDIVAMIVHKYMHVRFSRALLAVDSIVVLSGLVVIGFGLGKDEAVEPSWHLSFYSLIAIWVMSKVIAYVINGAKNDKLIFVISDQKLTDLHQFILVDLERTATCIKSSGLYSGKEKEMLFLVVSYKEVARIKTRIKLADPHAFVVVTDAYDTFGEGWKPLPSENDLQPE